VPVEPEWSHYPSLSYVAYLATGDSYYLEELQFAATFMIICAPPDFRGESKPRINDIQLRGLAWGLREVAKAYLATPDKVSAPLLPKAYWKAVLDNIRARMVATWIKNSSRLVQNAHMVSSYGQTPQSIGPWQHDYLGQVIGWMIYTGRFPEWKPIYDFVIQGQIIRATGPLRSQALQYWLEPNGATDWPSLLKLNGKAPTGDGHFPPNIRKESPHYAGMLRAALSLAVKNGIKGADEAFAYVNAETRRVGLVSLRHAV
jgi:hypothetical protein